MAPGSTPVLLLKTKSSPTDAYEGYFRDASNGNYDPRFVPVLDHRFATSGVSYIRKCIEERAFCGSTSKAEDGPYGGLVFTSQRAVDAFAQVIHDLRSEQLPVEELLPHSIPIYVVGPATARGLRALNLPCPMFGEQTGNGDVLADFILQEYNKFHSERANGLSSKPGLLFPVGEQRRDIISRTLQSESLPVTERIAVHELPVYETAVMETFAADFAREVQPALQTRLPQWIVVFSPTGCKVMLEGLGFIDPESGKAAGPSTRSATRALIATIGPTTQAYLIREFGLEPDVCSSKPSPEGLGASIAEFEMSHPDLLT